MDISLQDKAKQRSGIHMTYLYKKRQSRGEDDIESAIKDQVGHGSVPDQRKLVFLVFEVSLYNRID